MQEMFSKIQEEGPGMQDIENRFNVTILFPDISIMSESTGWFKSQDEFREYLFKNQGQRVKHALHTRPSTKRAKEYQHNEYIRAFPLQFPYGYAGLPKQDNMEKFKGHRKNRLDTNKTLKYLLRGRRKELHTSEFNLFTNSLVMREATFESARLQCNLRSTDCKSMGEKFGQMSWRNLNNSVNKARANQPTISSDVGDSFLRSVEAICRDLPHSNNAASEARQKYFSVLARRGFPPLFVTISPDDQRSFWIEVHLMRDQGRFACRPPRRQDFTDEDLLFRFEQRSRDRTDYPGLGAEDFMAITECFIREVLNWDVEKQEPRGVGLFGLIEAIAQATEEQGRKSLHAHFLLWIKNWNDFIIRIMDNDQDPAEKQRDILHLKKFASHCASSQIFHNFQVGKPLSHVRPFRHSKCRDVRREQASRFTVTPVIPEQYKHMQHKSLCKVHEGHIANCPKCHKQLRINPVLQNCLTDLFGSQFQSGTVEFPDGQKRKLEQIVYDQQSNFRWWEESPLKIAKREFAADVHTNTHRVEHSPRCFKKDVSCYAGLPAPPNDCLEVRFAALPCVWKNWDGSEARMRLFEVNHERPIPDAYTNTHNSILTLLFLCNTNVILAMTGAAIFYVTCYQHKKTQKEERIAYEKMARILLKVLKRQEEVGGSNDHLAPEQEGIRRLLMAVYRHSQSLVIAGPMAHYLAIHESRYRFSDDFEYLPIGPLSKMIRGEKVSMNFSLIGKNQRKAYCRAMDYLFRPADLEDYCPYEFWSSILVTTKNEARKNGLDYYDFVPDHPKHKMVVCAVRKKPVTPIVDWTFTGSAKDLPVSLFWEKNPTTTTPTTFSTSPQEEDYCRRFLLLFYNYRAEQDLKLYGSYKRRLVSSHELGVFAPYLQIAQNIQNIRNSLESGIMNDNIPPENEFENDIQSDSDDGEEDDNDQELHDLVAAFFHSTMDGKSGKDEPEPVEFTFPEPSLKNENAQNTISEEPKSVFSFKKEKLAKKRSHPGHYHRYKATVHGLNSLVQEQFVIQDGQGRTSVKPIGSVESIIAFGVSKRLDLDQQTAFEILVADFVLSFVNDSVNTVPVDRREEEIPQLLEEQKMLQDLAQVSSRQGKPLRMFLTGPAGAGKCKYTSPVDLSGSDAILNN